MNSLKTLYKIGNGPSSSHTMAPQKAATDFKMKFQEATAYKVILYGSLALTGKGHLTDYIIYKTLEKVEVIFDMKTPKKHPNTMTFLAYKGRKKLGEISYLSVGGGNFIIEGETEPIEEKVYFQKNFAEIKIFCLENKIDLYEYAIKHENSDFLDHIKIVWNQMKKNIANGTQKTEVLPGELKVKRKAKLLHQQINPTNQSMLLPACYAFAVSEENASGEKVVTAPTCGSCGIVPAVLKTYQDIYTASDELIYKALVVAGVIGNIIRTNASISGAVCGCQAEIGSATSMAAAAYAYLLNLDINQIECAAEIAMEHQLGLTCDPIKGYVQIPCIERNAVAANRAIEAAKLATYISDQRKLTFDMVVKTMHETGIDLLAKYRETSEGGLAINFHGDL